MFSSELESVARHISQIGKSSTHYEIKQRALTATGCTQRKKRTKVYRMQYVGTTPLLPDNGWMDGSELQP